MNFYERTKQEQDIIRACYEAEIKLIKKCSSKRNPYFDALMALPDGKVLWAALNDAVEMRFCVGV